MRKWNLEKNTQVQIKLFISNMAKVIRLTESDLARIVKRVIQEQADDSEVVVKATEVKAEDKDCFRDASKEEALAVGLNHGHKYKVKKKGCMTKTKYKGPKTKYRGNNWP